MLHELYHFDKMVTEAYEEFSPNKGKEAENNY